MKANLTILLLFLYGAVIGFIAYQNYLIINKIPEPQIVESVKEYHPKDEVFILLTAEQMLALTIYGEARGESYEGKVAVGAVILERVRHDRYGNSVWEVCLKPYQFSCFLPTDPNRKLLKRIASNWDWEDTTLNECLEISRGLLSGEIGHDLIKSNKATYYHSKDITARWAYKKKSIGQIGNHIFYRT